MVIYLLRLQLPIAIFSQIIYLFMKQIINKHNHGHKETPRGSRG